MQDWEKRVSPVAPDDVRPKGIMGRRRNRVIDPNSSARRPVSRVLSAPPLVSLWRAGRPFLWDAPRGAPHATNPDGEAGMPLRRHRRSRPYSVLLPVGFTLPPLLPGARCALAAPFRPCPRGAQWGSHGAPCAGGLFSVALSLGSPPPAIGRHRIPVEPGLSSAGSAGQARGQAAAVRPSGGAGDAREVTPRQAARYHVRWAPRGTLLVPR